ncbi:MAG: hypothetical protein KHX34_08590 [Clostridiales bacterium]|nr:hypothetical protein [Clostridiales bacterium]
MIIWGYVVMISRRWLSLLLALLLLLPAAALASSADVVKNVTTGKTYATLHDAVTEAAAGNTLALQSSVSLSKPLVIDKSLTLDLGGNTLNLTKCSITMNAPGAALTLRAAGGGISGTGAPCFDIEKGTLNILSGAYQSDVAVISTVEGVITVSGGTLAGGTGSSGNRRTIYSYGASKIRLENNAAVTNANDACVSLYGGDLTVSGNASLSGAHGVLLFNDKDNTTASIHSSVTMTGGTVTATKYFALSGNNLKSAGSKAVITGGSLSSPSTTTAIYWPMEGTLTIGGNATVTGGTAIEAKMGNITIKDQAVITGTGAWNENEPENGGSSPEGSALLLSTQLYGQNKGQFIDSPDLTVQLSGGRLVSGKGNAVTVFNTETNDEPASVAVTGSQLEGRRTSLKVISPNSAVTNSFVNNGLTSTSDKTTVSVSGGAAAAIAGSDGKSVIFYPTLDAAIAAATSGEVLVLSDNGLTPEVLTDPHVQLVVAPGVDLRVVSGADGYTLVQTKNPDGSVTYELSDQMGKLPQPSVTASLSGGKLTATATSSTQGATFTYQWYLDGAPIPGATAATFTPTQKGSYYVEVQASVTIPDTGTVVLSPIARSAAVAFDSSPATPPKTGDSMPLALCALLALLSLAALTALAARRRRHG